VLREECKNGKLTLSANLGGSSMLPELQFRTEYSLFQSILINSGCHPMFSSLDTKELLFDEL